MWVEGERLLGGPIYTGSLSHAPFLSECARHLADGARAGSISEARTLHQLLHELGAELPVPLFHHVPSLALALRLNKGRVPNRSQILTALTNRGFAHSHSHTSVHVAVKTSAPVSVLCEILQVPKP